MEKLVTRGAHIPENAGSSPAPATITSDDGKIKETWWAPQHEAQQFQEILEQLAIDTEHKMLWGKTDLPSGDRGKPSKSRKGFTRR